ncbi:MAG: Rne/Rng family ribonuclease, partial [Chitinophagaceae bacterium]|nr:Rne/Rng family ribonuclease [Chitinophagaceae bacterium]
ILVQVIKEPISNKGPRITCELSLPGRFIVMMPFNNSVNISRKISSNDERKRLEKIIKSIKTDNFGIIVRTAAEGQSTADLHKDLLSLIEAWKNIQNNLFESTAPSKILSEQNKTTSLLRDLLSDDFNTIIANDEAIVKSAKEYISSFAPEKENMVQLHKNGASIFEHFGINKQVKTSFGKTVMLNSGGYLIIEHTEALTVIDVNSGHKFSGENQEATAMNCNMEAIKEIARQLRLRDIGGIIVVDLIDMRSADNRKAVSDAMYEFMKSDRAKHNTLQISKFGLLQITRQRLRPATKIITSEVCPSCQGSGKVRSSQVLIDDIEKHVKYLTSHIKNTLVLSVHPIVYGYLTKGFFSTIYRTWKKKYGKFGLQENNDLEYIQYKFSDSSTDEEIKF